MMRQIGIFGLTHQNYLSNLCKILDTDANEVTVFTTDDILADVGDDLGSRAGRFDWMTQDGSVLSFLRRIEAASAELDLLLISSYYGGVVDLLSSLRFDPKCQTFFWVYNVESWLGGKYSLSDRLVENANRWCRRRLISRFAPINVEYPPLCEYIEDHTSYSGDVYSLAPTLYDPESGPKTTATDNRSHLQITVPGFIQRERRDYDVVLDLYERLLDQDVSLCLLGKPKGKYGHGILNRCREFECRGGEVTYYTDWIPIQEFHSRLSESDLLLCPLRETIRKATAEEIYGTTKGSGCVWDAIRSETPVVLPESFTVAEFIESSARTYEDLDGLTAMVKRLTADPDRLADLKRAASENSQQFTLENQKDRYESVLSHIVDST